MTKIQELGNIIEALLLAAEQALSIEKLQKTLSDYSDSEIQQALKYLSDRYIDNSIELVKVASGYKFQVKAKYNNWVKTLLQNKARKFSKSVLEILAIIAYKQPVTRGDIESIRGVAVNSTIMQLLLARELIRISGHRLSPGKPALYITTKKFLDYFNLENIEQLPKLAKIEQVDLLSATVKNEE